jgi:hypothetical protein
MMLSQRVLRLELLILLLVVLVALDAADGKAVYVGGTLNQIKSGQNGQMVLNQTDILTYATPKLTVEVPYTMVRSIEYGQKVDRRYLEALLISPVFLLSKKRDHFLTIHYRDAEGHDQAMVLRLPKSSVRPTLASLEARTGMKVKVQDDEARKAYRS